MDKWTALRCSPACPLIHRPYGYGCYPFGNIYYEATRRPSVTVSFDASRSHLALGNIYSGGIQSQKAREEYLASLRR